MGMLVVGISDLKVASPPDTLITYALGSCVGICLQDPAIQVGGLAHIMLPTSTLVPGDQNIFKFADTAIPYMVKRMEALGASRARIKAKIAGGAQMFEIQGLAAAGTTWNIGQRNVSAVVEVLGQLRIPIIARDVLENYGRTVTFDPMSGVMIVKSLSKNIKTI